MKFTPKFYLKYYVGFPLAAALLGVVLQALHVISVPWFLPFVPVLISTPVGLFLLAVLFIIEWLFTNERDKYGNDSSN